MSASSGNVLETKIRTKPNTFCDGFALDDDNDLI